MPIAKEPKMARFMAKTLRKMKERQAVSGVIDPRVSDTKLEREENNV